MIINSNQIKSTQIRNLALLALVVVLLFCGVLYYLSDHNSTELDKKKETTNFVNPLEHIDAESIVLEKTQKELREAKKETDNLNEKYTSLTSDEKTQEESTQKTNQELIHRIEVLEKKLTNNQGNLDNSNSHPMEGSNSYQQSYIPNANSQQEQFLANTHGIREDILTLKPIENEKDKRPLKNPDTYVPSGAFVSAVMLSGADASAAVNSQSNPEPIVLRIIDEGTLPNHAKSHLKDCTLTAAAIGDVSSERGKNRTERLSCTFPNGEIVEQEVEGTIVGPDGKNGVSGNPLWRDGAITQKVFAAGFMSGIANGVSSSYTTNSISPIGAVETINSSKLLQNGVANGGAKAMDKLSEYYIQRAEQYHPVIQLSAGTIVDVLFLKGFFLDGKKHENTDKTVGNYSASKSTSLFPTQPSDAQTLPLTDEEIKRLKEHSKELGLRVTQTSISG